jgi:hypothetical protein
MASYSETRNPTINDDYRNGYRSGDTWTNTSTNASYYCSCDAVGGAVWATRDVAPRESFGALSQRRNMLWESTGSGVGNDDYVVVPAGTWTTIVTGTGRGVIARITTEMANGNHSKAFIRIRFNGAAVAQFGGEAGIPLDHFLGCQGVTAANKYQSHYFGQMVLADNANVGGYNAMLMPFTDGFTIEVLHFSDASVNWYMMVWLANEAEWPFTSEYLYAQTVSRDHTSGDDVLWDYGSGPVALVGWLHEMHTTGAGDLESNQVIKYGSDLSTSTNATGAEDPYDGNGWYFLGGELKNDLAGALEAGGTPVIVYLFFGTPAQQYWPADDERVQLLWLAGAGVSSVITVFYYARSAPTFAAPVTPTGLTVDAVSAATASLSWDVASGMDTAGYQLFRNGTLVYQGPASAFADAALDSATAYTYTVKAYNAAGVVSAASAGVVATTEDGAVLSTPAGVDTNYARTSSNQLTLSGTTLVVEIELALSNWTTNGSDNRIVKLGGPNQFEWSIIDGFHRVWIGQADGTPEFYQWGPQGYANGTYQRLRMSYTCNNGTGNRQVLFERHNGTAWVTVSASTKTGTQATIRQVTTDAYVGGHNFNQFTKSLKVTDGSGVILDMTFSLHAGETTPTDESGNTWALFGTATIAEV